MPRLLVVTNDFPPTIGGIQSYVRDFLDQVPPEDVVVFASTQDAAAAAEWDSQAPYTVVRWPHKVMLPTPGVARAMSELIAKYDIQTVWFGAAAPLALLAPAARRAGARRVVASTHGHEVGWSMVPGGRQALRRIGWTCDAVTYISNYALGRLRGAFGAGTTWERLPSGVDAGAYRRSSAATRTGLTVLCVSRLVPRKGQDTLIRVWPRVVACYPAARLVLVGEGPYEQKLRELARGVPGIEFTGRVSDEQKRALLLSSDVFAMPVRTRGGGLDVEGLGIVLLEAQAAGLPVIVGDSGGAPETVTPESGMVVDGRDEEAVATALIRLLGDADLRSAMGQAGERHVREHWSWDKLGEKLRKVLFD